MTQEEKIILLQDLCARLSYGICVHIRYKEGEPCYGKLTPRDIQWFIDSKIENIKPYLRPMSSMTGEEKCQFRKFIDWTYDCNWKDNTIVGLLNGNGIISRYAIELFDWLNKRMFDYRDLIPMGLALEAPKNMYKI